MVAHLMGHVLIHLTPHLAQEVARAVESREDGQLRELDWAAILAHLSNESVGVGDVHQLGVMELFRIGISLHDRVSLIINVPVGGETLKVIHDAELDPGLRVHHQITVGKQIDLAEVGQNVLSLSKVDLGHLNAGLQNLDQAVELHRVDVFKRHGVFLSLHPGATEHLLKHGGEVGQQFLRDEETLLDANIAILVSAAELAADLGS